MMQNIFNDLKVKAGSEKIKILFENQSIKIERIVSNNSSSPKEFWYDQAQDEWVVIIQGEGVLEFAEKKTKLTLKKGDYYHIPAHLKHRVYETSSEEPTIWLAIHFDTHINNTLE